VEDRQRLARVLFDSRPRNDFAIGWARDLERRGVRVTVNVVVRKAFRTRRTLPAESRARSARTARRVIAVMNDDELPMFIDVTRTGSRWSTRPSRSQDEEAAEDETEAAADSDTATRSGGLRATA
jgi:hypothetical protein